MLSKTHMAAGLFASLALFHPDSMALLAAGSGMALAGGVFPDIDLGRSVPGRNADEAFIAMSASFGGVAALEFVFDLGIRDRFFADLGFRNAIYAFICFLVLFLYGMFSRHRTFTHGIFGLLGYGGLIYIMTAELAPYFIAGMVSHTLLDLLNKKKIALFYPLSKRGSCLKLCRSDGKADHFLYLAFLFADLILITELVWENGLNQLFQ